MPPTMAFTTQPWTTAAVSDTPNTTLTTGGATGTSDNSTTFNLTDTGTVIEVLCMYIQLIRHVCRAPE